MVLEMDQRVRLAAFAFLEQHVRLHGEVLPRDVLLQEFLFDGHRVPLMADWTQRALS
jgi:hypothetical protein